MTESLDVWRDRLHAAAMATLAGTPLVVDADERARRSWIAGFRDERGNRPAVAVPLMHHLAGLRGEIPERSTADVAWWWGVAAGDLAVFADGRLEGPLLPTTPEDPGGGPMGEGVEVWSEAELCALHAASRAGVPWSRCVSAASWLMCHVQPDNATNRPWAIHVFLRVWSETGDFEARLYAETLLHNCRVQFGRPDVLSAMVLLDASRALGAG